MREIKFRAWDIDGRCYIPNTGNPNIFPFNGMVGMTCNGSNTGCISTDEWIQDSYVLEQYTGLKDKNGKEIYDGDIITEGDRLMIVEWSERSAGWSLRSKGWMFNHFFNEAIDAVESEIVGNIHENPELIK
jgi:hypothetical protein